MVLTNHQILHLDAVIVSATAEGNTQAVQDAENMLMVGVFPKLLKDSYIADYLEKDSDGIKHNQVISNPIDPGGL